MPAIVLIRGGGDLASGIALRLFRAGFRIIITELAHPMAVRRLVSFAEAVYLGQQTVEGITGQLAKDPMDSLSILMILSKGKIPVVIDPQGEAITHLHPTIVVDARMLKLPVELDRRRMSLLIGLGPGFEPGVNCHAAVETKRGHFLGRVLWKGTPEADTHYPESLVDGYSQRVLRAPVDGIFNIHAEIGDSVEAGQLIADVEGQPVVAAVNGILRGLLHAGVQVNRDVKVGDIDPRAERRYCMLVSDKALAIGGGVLEAILSRTELRAHLWT